MSPAYRRRRKDWWKYRWLRAQSIGTVLDIGANTGQFATRVRHALPEAQIYSFEPLADCYQRLVGRMGGDPKFLAFPVALGDAPGQAVIHRSAHRPASSLLEQSDLLKRIYPEAGPSEPETITIRTLDEVATSLKLTGNVLVKIDVQGYEDRVIRGGTKTIASAKALLMEISFQKLYEGQLLFEGLFDLVRPLGFTFHGLQGQALDETTGQLLFGDAVFLK